MTARNAGIIFGGLLVVAGAIVLCVAWVVTAAAREGAPVRGLDAAWCFGAVLALAGLVTAGVCGFHNHSGPQRE